MGKGAGLPHSVPFGHWLMAWEVNSRALPRRGKGTTIAGGQGSEESHRNQLLGMSVHRSKGK